MVGSSNTNEQNSQKDEEKSPDYQKLIVPISQRYCSAWNEINSRFESRQNVYLQFTIASITILSIIFGFTDNYSLEQSTIFVSYGLVFFSLCFVFWIIHNDRIIGLLSNFCQTCEKMDNPYNSKKIPSWHTNEQEWIVEARNYRKYSDMAGIFIILINTLPSVFLFIGYFESNIAISILSIIMVVIGIVAAILLCYNGEKRKEISKYEFKKKDDKYKLQKP
ncbi:MAG: hypothetical protein KAQ92_01030 [Candidatus Aenigmarchaeota archaeon]|nr:hypothetical protein [Candidatus Aenigmarchaeota archaeon]